MLTGILQGTPYWVWGILAVLVALGLTQVRTRRVPRFRVFILPLIMIPLSLNTIVAGFGFKPLPIVAWAAGIVLALLLNGFVLKSPQGVRFDRSTNTFEIPGSWIPLLLMMVIFCSRFALGVTRAINPALIATDTFSAAVCIILGFCSGLFAARAIKTLAAQRS